MNGITIGFIVSLITICGAFAKIIADYVRLKEHLTILETNFQEEKKSSSTKFRELYDSRNELNTQMVRVATILDSVADRLTSLEKKIDDLKTEINDLKKEIKK